MSEQDWIKALVKRFGLPAERIVVPSGDDAAVVRPAGGVSVTSIDAVVQGVHFQLPTWPLEAVGHKAVGAALSDLAAMGAAPGEVYVAAGLPRDFASADFDALCDGIAAAADTSGAVVAGGDLSSAEQLWLSVTVVGWADSAAAIVTRAGAQAGDAIVLTGDLGASARALELLAAGAGADDPRLAKQFAPQPRFAAGAALAAHGATAMIDISDGLARDAGHVAAASGMQLKIDVASIPLAEGIDSGAVAAASGEEYELLATLPERQLKAATEAVARTGTALTTIGRVTEGSGAELLDLDGARLEVRGFDHFD